MTSAAPIPFVMLNVNGMTTIARNAGSADAGSDHGISPTSRIKRRPTSTSTGAVASGGTIAASGEKTSVATKHAAHATDASPVRPPSATPAALSM